MIWALFTQLGQNMWFLENEKVHFDDEAWNEIVERSAEAGINMMVLDLGEGVHYGSHPELAHPGAWTRERVRSEVKRLRKKGIELIPKLNFSAMHHLWLGDYRRMLGLPKYYEVCRDLIQEVYNLFDKPRFIHLGMDEEDDSQFFEKLDLVAFRRGELLWHDLQFLCDCVSDMGAKPWIWADICFEYPEEFRKRITAGSVMLSPWYYSALKEEHFTLIKDYPADNKEEYFKGMTYVEEHPFRTRFLNNAVPAAKDGYDILPCVSNWGNCPYNADDHVDYFINNTPKEKLAGFITAPWKPATTKAFLPEILEAIQQLKEAKEKYTK